MKKILLIEDNNEILENTAEILELAGYEVYTSSGGKEGVEKAIAYHPDLIISDIMMPALDGYGVLHLVQKNPELSGVPFIFLTAKTDRSDFRKGMEMGADDYITKPFNDTELLNAVETRLKKAEKAKSYESDKGEVGKQEHTLKELFENSVVDKYRRKQIIFTEGNHPQFLFYVVKGKVKAFKTSEYGKELTVGLYAAGDFIGYTALLQESTYKVTAEALEETEIAVISRKDFFDLVDSNSAVAMQFIRILANKNNQKAEQMVQLAYDSLRKRVANALLLLQKKFNADTEEKFIIKITREELANLSGTSTESLIRTLSDFRSEKLIAIHGGDIEILSKKKLENMVN